MSIEDTATGSVWHPTACILCESNCGVEVQLGPDGRSFERIRGDRRHPSSRGYTCNKALRLDFYQNGRTGRVTAPLRRRADGSFEECGWDTAIGEISQRLLDVGRAYGPETILYYGGGGQGNHLGGAYAAATRAAYGVRYMSSALAQEKTGEFWVAARMLGGYNRAEIESGEVVVFVGKNPYQSHGFPRARAVLKEIARDPARSLIVIDPVRTETAELGDLHLQLLPGTDAYLLAALAAQIVRDDGAANEWITAHADGWDQVRRALADVPVDAYCRRAGVPVGQLRTAARLIAGAASVAMLEDLGVQMNRESTLVSYLEKLIWLITGNFAKPGTQYLSSSLFPIGRDAGHRVGEGPRSPVLGAPVVSGLIPATTVAEEILTDHPRRFRAAVVESANPAHSLAESARVNAALQALDLLVVVDVAMTETARLADYVLPTPTQYEKHEATFFNFEFPRNYFHLRRPVLTPPAGVLPEPEIHARLVEAAGVLTEADYRPLREAARSGRPEFGRMFTVTMRDRPELAGVAPVLLYRTLGPTLAGDATAAAVLWAAAHRCARFNPEGVHRAGYGTGPAAGDNLFDAILAGPHGVTITDETHESIWHRVHDGRIQLAIPELLARLDDLPHEPDPSNPQWPFVLTAGHRRSFTANTILRDPRWRRRDAEGALWINPADAERIGALAGGRVRVSTKAGSVEVTVETTDRMQPGHVALPNGFGLLDADTDAENTAGAAPNALTSASDRDAWVGTPFHKYVPADVKAVSAANPSTESQKA
ncbi:molybdopterin-dependent oxidoreductase [Cryptosporangium sp. NPDC048952]|uniref:molybdopterin-dependent oxidoreductase n=1 Tax=Cryptosporangium sp. NPDC048952 TaxID=3363961 RepID=UPI00371FE999